jgi:hypothetical protein
MRNDPPCCCCYPVPTPNRWEPLLPLSVGEDATERAAEGKAPEVRPRWLAQVGWPSSEEGVGATHAGATGLQISVAWEPLVAAGHSFSKYVKSYK